MHGSKSLCIREKGERKRIWLLLLLLLLRCRDHCYKKQSDADSD